MAFMRTDTPKSMLSRAWSTNDLSAALEHSLLHKDELPDDLGQLEVRVFESSWVSVGFRILRTKPVGSCLVHCVLTLSTRLYFFSHGSPLEELERAIADMNAIDSAVWGLDG